jgi:hypothetical protein
MARRRVGPEHAGHGPETLAVDIRVGLEASGVRRAFGHSHHDELAREHHVRADPVRHRYAPARRIAVVADLHLELPPLSEHPAQTLDHDVIGTVAGDLLVEARAQARRHHHEAQPATERENRDGGDRGDHRDRAARARARRPRHASLTVSSS